MKKKVQILEHKRENSEISKRCVHHWIIDFATGPTSLGYCKNCGAKKTFFNIIEDAQSKDDLSRFFDKPLDDIESGINYN